MTDTRTLDPGTSGPDPFELIDTDFSPYPMERWRADAMAMGLAGGMSAMHQLYAAVRNDAIEAEARVNEMEARKGLVQHLCDQIAGMQERINRLEDALEARHKADAERAARDAFEEEPLSLPPGDPPSELDPAIAADRPDMHALPGGELHVLEAKDEPELEGEGDLPEPSLEIEDTGALPEELAKYVELEDPPEPNGSVFPQTVSIQLNRE